jgi:hypothetical protein
VRVRTVLLRFCFLLDALRAPTVGAVQTRANVPRAGKIDVTTGKNGSPIFARVAKIETAEKTIHALLILGLLGCSAALTLAFTLPAYQGDRAQVAAALSMLRGLVATVSSYALLLAGVRGVADTARRLARLRVLRSVRTADFGGMRVDDVNAILGTGESAAGWAVPAAYGTLRHHLSDQEWQQLRSAARTRLMSSGRDARLAQLAVRYSGFDGQLRELACALELSDADLRLVETLSRHLTVGLNRTPRADGTGPLGRIGQLHRDRQEAHLLVELTRVGAVKRRLLRQLLDTALSDGTASGWYLCRVWDAVELLSDEQAENARLLAEGWTDGALSLAQAARTI